jgi:hypothetical protein
MLVASHNDITKLDLHWLARRVCERLGSSSSADKGTLEVQYTMICLYFSLSPPVSGGCPIVSIQVSQYLSMIVAPSTL